MSVRSGRWVRACAEVDEAATTMWAARTGRELMETVEAVATLEAKLEGIKLAVVQPSWRRHGRSGGAQGRRLGLGQGLRHPHHRRTAERAVSRRCGWRGSWSELPAVAEALAAGRLSRVQAQHRRRRDRAPITGRVTAGARAGRDARGGAAPVRRGPGAAGRHILEVVDPDGVDARLERTSLARSAPPTATET